MKFSLLKLRSSPLLNITARACVRVCVCVRPRGRLCTRACNVKEKSYIENNATVIVTVQSQIKISDQLRPKLAVLILGLVPDTKSTRHFEGGYSTIT